MFFNITAFTGVSCLNTTKNELETFCIGRFTTNNPLNAREQSYQNLGKRKLTGIEFEGRGQLFDNTWAFVNYAHVLDGYDELNGITFKDGEELTEENKQI